MLKATTGEGEGVVVSVLPQPLLLPGMDRETSDAWSIAGAKHAMVRRTPSVPLAPPIVHAQSRPRTTFASSKLIPKAKLSPVSRGSLTLDSDIPRAAPVIPDDSFLVEARLLQRRVRRGSKWQSDLHSETLG